MQSKESFSQFEHKVFKSKLNGLPCFNCGENNHSQNQCRFNARLECYQCHSLGHKAKLCWMNPNQYSQEHHYRQQYASLHYISEFLVLYSDSFC
jgi:hypothetical protein